MKCHRQIFGFQSRGGSNELGKTEAARGGVLFKKVFCLKGFSHEGTCVVVPFLIKLQARSLQLCYKKTQRQLVVFLLTLQILWDYLFYRTLPGDCFLKNESLSTLFIAEGTSQHGFRYHLNVLCNIINTTEFWFWGKRSLPLPLH